MVIPLRPEARAEFDQAAQRDPLTGLDCMPGFSAALRGAARRRRGGENPWVAVAGLGGAFSNDADEPLVADQLLATVAARLADSVRDGDKVARIGPDTFGLIVDAPHGDEATVALERLAKGVASLIASDRRWAGARICIGLAPLWSQDPELALRRASEALDRGRRRGATVAMTTGQPPASGQPA